MPTTSYALKHADELHILTQRLDRVEAFMNEYFDRGSRQAAVVKLQRFGKSIFEGSYGKLTNMESFGQDTIFPMASVTKPVMAALLLILQEDGLIDFGEPVSHFLPEFTGGGRGDVCVWHLLTHSSGINEEELDKDFDHYIENELGLKLLGDNATHKQWVELHRNISIAMGLDPNGNELADNPFYKFIITHDMKHKPRSEMTYCNLGFRMLKVIVDKITGEPIDQFAKRVLFDPIGMHNTHFVLPREKWALMAGRAEGAKGAKWYHTEDYFNDTNGASGMKSTSNDISLFLQMLLDNGVAGGKRILSPASMQQMLVNHNEGVACGGDRKWSAWGYGINVRTDKHDDTGALRSSRAFCHGGWGGIKAAADPFYGTTMTIMSIEYDPEVREPEPLYARVFNILCTAME